ncbi:MAG: CDC27 family protein [Campylobacterota bacterium]|nr:CDC27 family protein [Campylobacterota bacterium]
MVKKTLILSLIGSALFTSVYAKDLYLKDEMVRVDFCDEQNWCNIGEDNYLKGYKLTKVSDKDYKVTSDTASIYKKTSLITQDDTADFKALGSLKGKPESYFENRAEFVNFTYGFVKNSRLKQEIKSLQDLTLTIDTTTKKVQDTTILKKAEVKVDKKAVKEDKPTVVMSDKEKKKIVKGYTSALKLYKLKQYQKAYEQFNVLFESNLDDANINFYLGRSAFELKKYHEAILAFDRILFSKPDASRVKLEMAKAYFMSKKYADAKLYFDELNKDPKTPKNIKEGIGKYLAIIDENTKKNFVNAIFLAGLAYDSNINNRSSYDLFDIPNLPNPATNTVPGEADWAHQEVVIVNHKYNKNEKNVIKNDLLLFAKTMVDSKNSAKDIRMIAYTPTWNHIYDNGLAMDYSIFTDALWINDISNLKTYGLMPKFTYMIDKKIITKGHLKYQTKKNQVQTAKINDSKYIELHNNWQLISPKGIAYGFGVTVTSEDQNTEVANSTIDKDSVTLKANSTYLIKGKYSLAPTLSYKYTKNDKEDFMYGVRRADNEYKFSVVGTYIHTPKWLFQAGGDYVKNDSNIEANEYSKHTFTLNVIRIF